MPARQKVPEALLLDVLIKSRRRCCLCVFLLHDRSVKKGQIAHLNRDPSDNSERNLAFLCLDHHDEYDQRTSVSKGLAVAEVRRYRDLLYAENENGTGEGRFTENFGHLSDALLSAFRSSAALYSNSTLLRKHFLELNRDLIRMQTILQEIGELEIDDAESLWLLAPARSQSLGDAEATKLALLNRYLHTMSDLAITLQGVAGSLVLVHAPELAGYLTMLWDTKLDLYQVLATEQRNRTLADKILAKEAWFILLEATKTLEGHVLLQVVDEEARVVARDLATGLNIFGELHRNKEVLMKHVDYLREGIIGIIRENGGV